jgi:cytochrome c-type biogenesis protein CcmH
MKIELFLCLLWAEPALAATGEALADPEEEARAVILGNELRCVVYQSEAINDSQADMARDMRMVVREKIHQGWSDTQIVGFVRAR